MKPYCLIINPTAGRGRAAGIGNRLENKLREENILFHSFYTEGEGDGERRARGINPEKYSRICVVGGDGTLQEVVRGLKTPMPPLAIFPGGTGNDVARLLGITGEDEAWKTAAFGRVRHMDLGMASGTPFVNMFSLGFDAAIAHQANLWKHKLPANLLYPLALVKTLFSFKAPTVRLTFENQQGETVVREEAVMLVAVCNGSHYGGGMNINPEADPFDGWLELCVVQKMSKVKLLALFPTIYKGTHLKYKEVSLQRVRRAVLKSDEMLMVNRDGEAHRGKEGDISVIPGRLPVMFPE